MSRKILSVVLALVLIMSTFVTVAFAAANYEKLDEKTGLSEYTQYWSLSEAVDNGDGTYSVDVNLKTNYHTGSINFKLVEDDANELIELESAVLGSAIPADYNAEIQITNSKTEVFIYPEATQGYSAAKAVIMDGVIATLTFSYTGSGKATVGIANDPKTAANAGGTLIATRMGNKTIASTDNITGQTVVDANGVAITDAVLSPVEIGTEVVAADPVLKAVEGSTGFVDVDRKFVYGVPAGTTADDFTDYFTVENGSFVMEANDANCDNGTGAILVVKNNDGEVFDRYTLVIFGDVNGDGLIQTPDATDIYIYLADKLPLSDAQKFAADVNADGVIQTPDATDIYIHLADKGDIKPNIWA